MSTVTTDLETCLRERFRLDEFRPGQRPVIETVLERRDCLCVMPTGGGKSLCYQLPSLLLDGVTLVVSPLIALMKDQVDRLIERGIRATLINSTVDTATQNERIAAMERGEFDLVYVAPERFRSNRFNEAMSRTRVALLAVDEAHCISEWGHDFRPDYTRLGRARRRLKSPPTIALTATATDNVRRDICEQLELSDPSIFITGFDRPNLRYGVRYASSEAAKQQALKDVLRSTPGAGIIYCSSRKRCEEVAQFLRDTLNRESVVYHAGMLPPDRRAAQDTFMSGRNQIVVATNAFGMGVDKPDIRFVVHYNIPGTIEAYYQEAGRAGRDGAESLCMLLFSPGDRAIQEFFIESEFPSRDVVATIYEFLCRQREDPIELTQEQLKERLKLEISDMGVGASLKLLEAAGALERLRPRENMAIIRIDSEVSLVGLLPTNAAIQRRVLSALERLVQTRPGDDTYFSPYALADRLELEPAQFSRAIHELCEKLPVDYVPPFRGNAVRMLDRDRKPTELGIDFDKLEKRKQREFEKLEQVMRYAQSKQCRRQTILHYFGDDSLPHCGHCDNCNATIHTPGAPIENTEQGAGIVRKVLAGIARATTHCRFGLGKRIIAGMLAGKNIKAIKKWRLDKLSTFGLLEDYSEDEIVLLIEALLAIGWVEQSEPERFRPVINLTETGLEVMRGDRPAAGAWRLPDDLLKKIRGDDTPAKRKTAARTGPDRELEPPAADPPARADTDRALLRQLKNQRDRWAAESRLPAYMVLANSVIDELARRRPRSLDAMLNVKGMGPAKIAKYGEALLQLIDPEPEPKPPARPAPTTAPPIPVKRPQRNDARQRESGRLAPAPEPHESAPARTTSDHYWTWRLLERGFTQSECALIRNIDEHTVLDHAVEAARLGLAVPLDAFLPAELIRQLEQSIDRNAAPSPGTEALPDGILQQHIELLRMTRRAHAT